MNLLTKTRLLGDLIFEVKKKIASQYYQSRLGHAKCMSRELQLLPAEFSGSRSTEEEVFLDELRIGIIRAYPNPERVGCPDESALHRAAFGGLKNNPDLDAVMEHAHKCGPCTRQIAVSSRRRRARGRLRRRTCAGMTAIQIVWIATLHWQASCRSHPVALGAWRDGDEDRSGQFPPSFSGDLDSVFVQNAEEHHAVFDDHVPQEQGILKVRAQRVNARIADERSKSVV